MAKEEPKTETKPTEVGLVRVSQETGVGMQMPDGEVVDLSGVDLGTAQIYAYLVKTVSDLKKNIG